MQQQSKGARAFRSGDRVYVDGELGTIVNVFPDGIHMVRLDRGGQVIAVVASQIEAAELPDARRWGWRQAV